MRFFTNDKQGWIVGGLGTMLRTEDGGKTWIGMSEEQKTKTLPYGNGMPEPLDGVHFVSPKDGLAVGDLGVILRTTDGGRTWKAQKSGTGTRLTQTRFISEKEAWAAGKAVLCFIALMAGIHGILQSEAMIFLMWSLSVTKKDGLSVIMA